MSTCPAEGERCQFRGRLDVPPVDYRWTRLYKMTNMLMADVSLEITT